MKIPSPRETQVQSATPEGWRDDKPHPQKAPRSVTRPQVSDTAWVQAHESYWSHLGALPGPRTPISLQRGSGRRPPPAAQRERARRERGGGTRASGKAGAVRPRQDGGGRGRSGDCWRPVRRAGPAARRRGPGRAALGKAGAVSIAAAAGGVAPGNFLVPGLGIAGSLLEGEQCR